LIVLDLRAAFFARREVRPPGLIDGDHVCMRVEPECVLTRAIDAAQIVSEQVLFASDIEGPRSEESLLLP
jgi:hypothetical protein